MRLGIGEHVLDVLETEDGDVVVMVGTRVLVLRGAAAMVCARVHAGASDVPGLVQCLEESMGSPPDEPGQTAVARLVGELVAAGVLAESPS